MRRRTVGRSDRRTLLAATVIVTVSLSPTVRLSAQAFPTSPPKPTPFTPVRFPPFKETTLANGLQVVVIEHHEQPVVSVTLSFRAGGIYDPAGKEGAAGARPLKPRSRRRERRPRGRSPPRQGRAEEPDRTNPEN